MRVFKPTGEHLQVVPAYLTTGEMKNFADIPFFISLLVLPNGIMKEG
jgi:hypothetical protein